MTDFDKLSNAALHSDLETIRTMVVEPQRNMQLVGVRVASPQSTGLLVA